MAVVPSVVVDESRSVPHAGNLVPVVPPAHDRSVFGCVLSEPEVRLTEIVQNEAVPTVRGKRTKHDSKEMKNEIRQLS